MTIHVPLTLHPDSPISYTLEGEGQPLVHFENAGKSARLGNFDSRMFARHDVLRWGAPFALAPQGLVALHASAAHKDGLTVGFLGIGGAGKSTLACELSRRGWQPIADDLLVCDADGRVNVLAEQVLRHWCEVQASRVDAQPRLDYSDLARQLTESVNQDRQPLSGLAFLSETRGAANFALRPLSAGDHFHRLVAYGFGGLPVATAWAHQFDVYGTLAERVPGAILQAPDGLEVVRAALPQLEEGLRQWLGDCAVVRV